MIYLPKLSKALGCEIYVLICLFQVQSLVHEPIWQ